MAFSVGEQMMQAIAASLNAPADKPCLTYRTRIDAFAAEELPAFVFYSVSEEVSQESQNVVKRTRTVRLEAIVAGEPPADQLIDPLYVFAIATLAAADYSQYIRGMEEARIQWETEASYEDATIAFIDFTVVYTTKQDDPTEIFT